MIVVKLFKWLSDLCQVLLREHLTCCVLIFFTVLLVTRYCLLRRLRRLPPGPWGIPIMGYLPFLGKDVHLSMLKMSKRFGSIYRVSFGSKTFVVLTDPKVIRDAFRREEFTARPSTPLYEIFDGYGLMNVDGAMWKNQRRFLHERFRALGMKTMGHGREQMEAKIMNEVECLLQSLATEGGNALSIDTLFTNATSNVICSMLMSVRFAPDDPAFIRFMELHEDGFKLFMKSDIASYIPGLRYLPSIVQNVQQLKQNRLESSQMIRDIIAKRRRVFDPERVSDILDAYLLEEFRAKAEERELYDGKDFDRQLVQIMCDLFSAGEETVKTCLLWSLVYLLNNPKIMKRIQDELDVVVGRTRLPCLDDMPHLPYTEATIYEVLRRSTVVPLGTSHATTRDTILGDYTIPEGATVISLLYACHMDSDLWADPEKFEPQRFLDNEGRVIKPDYFMPFGVGRRMCLGDVLARSELFLFFSSILHVFNLANPDGDHLPSMEGNLGCTYTPKCFKVRFIPREVTTATATEITSTQDVTLSGVNGA